MLKIDFVLTTGGGSDRSDMHSLHLENIRECFLFPFRKMALSILPRSDLMTDDFPGDDRGLC